MRAICQTNSVSPDIRAEMKALGLLASRRSVGPPLFLAIALVDIAAAVSPLVKRVPGLPQEQSSPGDRVRITNV